MGQKAASQGALRIKMTSRLGKPSTACLTPHHTSAAVTSPLLSSSLLFSSLVHLHLRLSHPDRISAWPATPAQPRSSLLAAPVLRTPASPFSPAPAAPPTRRGPVLLLQAPPSPAEPPWHFALSPHSIQLSSISAVFSSRSLCQHSSPYWVCCGTWSV
ncbi:hypothetical protein IWX48DRAFT_195847 [Phyllosticta citricarpa]